MFERALTHKVQHGLDFVAWDRLGKIDRIESGQSIITPDNLRLCQRKYYEGEDCKSSRDSEPASPSAEAGKALSAPIINKESKDRQEYEPAGSPDGD